MIEIKSFSFIHTPQEIPPENKKVLWYVFDCRCITDPVLFSNLKDCNGTDKKIELFFEKETNMMEYLASIYKTIFLVVQNYKNNKEFFEKVVFNFGCLGGIHRSVFAAEYINKKLIVDFPDEEIVIVHTRNISK